MLAVRGRVGGRRSRCRKSMARSLGECFNGVLPAEPPAGLRLPCGQQVSASIEAVCSALGYHVLHCDKSTSEVVLVMRNPLGAQSRSVEPRVKGQKHSVQRDIGSLEAPEGARNVFVAHGVGLMRILEHPQYAAMCSPLLVQSQNRPFPKGWQPGIHQRRRMPKRSKSASLLTSVKPSIWDCAMSMRSNGSRCSPGISPACRACSAVIGKESKS
jgi:hypothetical protein